MKVTLTKEQYEELKTLKEGECLELLYKNLYCWITPAEYGNVVYEGRTYDFNFYSPSDIKMIVK